MQHITMTPTVGTIVGAVMAAGQTVVVAVMEGAAAAEIDGWKKEKPRKLPCGA